MNIRKLTSYDVSARDSNCASTWNVIVAADNRRDAIRIGVDVLIEQGLIIKDKLIYTSAFELDEIIVAA